MIVERDLNDYFEVTFAVACIKARIVKRTKRFVLGVKHRYNVTLGVSNLFLFLVSLRTLQSDDDLSLNSYCFSFVRFFVL